MEKKAEYSVVPTSHLNRFDYWCFDFCFNGETHDLGLWAVAVCVFLTIFIKIKNCCPHNLLILKNQSVRALFSVQFNRFS